MTCPGVTRQDNGRMEMSKPGCSAAHEQVSSQLILTFTESAGAQTKTVPRHLFVYSLGTRADSHHVYTLGFLSLALVTFGARSFFFVGGCPVAYSTFSSISWPDTRSIPPLVTIESVSGHCQMPPRGAESPQLRSTGVEVQGTASGASLPEVEPWLCSLYAVGPWTSINFHGGTIHKSHQSKATRGEGKRRAWSPACCATSFPTTLHPTAAHEAPLGTLRVPWSAT